MNKERSRNFLALSLDALFHQAGWLATRRSRPSVSTPTILFAAAQLHENVDDWVCFGKNEFSGHQKPGLSDGQIRKMIVGGASRMQCIDASYLVCLCWGGKA
jgi:hypothetical protein